MALFQLTSDWPIDQGIIPIGTHIDGSNPIWPATGIRLPTPFPIYVLPLDQAAADLLFNWYGDARAGNHRVGQPDMLRWLNFGPFTPHMAFPGAPH